MTSKSPLMARIKLVALVLVLCVSSILGALRLSSELDFWVAMLVCLLLASLAFRVVWHRSFGAALVLISAIGISTSALSKGIFVQDAFGVDLFQVPTRCGCDRSKPTNSTHVAIARLGCFHEQLSDFEFEVILYDDGNRFSLGRCRARGAPNWIGRTALLGLCFEPNADSWDVGGAIELDSPGGGILLRKKVDKELRFRRAFPSLLGENDDHVAFMASDTPRDTPPDPKAPGDSVSGKCLLMIVRRMGHHEFSFEGGADERMNELRRRHKRFSQHMDASP